MPAEPMPEEFAAQVEEVEAQIVREEPPERGRWQVRRKVGITAAVALLMMLCGVAEVLRRYGFQETRPVCEEGEDPMLRDCLPEMPKVNWKDPSFALVGTDETLVEIRWFKGLLFHPIGRFFGGHHSALIGVFSSGQQVRIEKFGLGNVQYCPTLAGKHCNLAPGSLYKRAGGKYVQNITWAQLHAAMIEDLEHYDVVDANCHHAVQRGWNAAVVPEAMDRSAGPDHSLLLNWERFLRRWASPADEGPDDQDEQSTPTPTQEAALAAEEEVRKLEANSRSQRRLAANSTNLSATPTQSGNMDTPVWGPESMRDSLGGDHWTSNGIAVPSFDANGVRRRRRRGQIIAPRCRGSKIDAGEGNCPQRASSQCDESSTNGGRISYKEFESFSKCRYHMSWFVTLFQDKDFTGCSGPGKSDWVFKRAISSGNEVDYSGSVHFRSQYRSSESCIADSSMEKSGEMQPMDPNRVEGNSKDADANNFVWASECSHSQDARSKGDSEHACNYNLTGVQASTTYSFMCQWTCVTGEVTFMTGSTSMFVCNDDEVSIALNYSSTENDCMTACQDQGCSTECTEKCRYIASAALDAGQAVCMNDGAVYSTGYGWEPLAQRGLSATVITWIVIYFCATCCCSVGGQVMKKNKDQD